MLFSFTLRGVFFSKWLDLWWLRPNRHDHGGSPRVRACHTGSHQPEDRNFPARHLHLGDPPALHHPWRPQQRPIHSPLHGSPRVPVRAKGASQEEIGPGDFDPPRSGPKGFHLQAAQLFLLELQSAAGMRAGLRHRWTPSTCQRRMPAQHIPRCPPQPAEAKETFQSSGDPSPFSRLAGVTAAPPAPRLPLRNTRAARSPQQNVLLGVHVQSVPLEGPHSALSQPAPRITEWSPISHTECSSVHSWFFSHRASPYFPLSSGCVKILDMLSFFFLHFCSPFKHLSLHLCSLELVVWRIYSWLGLFDSSSLATVSVVYYGFHSQVWGNCVVLVLYEHYWKCQCFKENISSDDAAMKLCILREQDFLCCVCLL